MGIRHIVSWKLSGNDEQRAALAQALAENLEGLMGNVPTLVGLLAKPNAVEADGNWDLVLIADFEDQAGLEAYQRHPDHVAVAKRMQEVAVDRSAIDILV